MSDVRVEHQTYEMPPREGFTVALFIIRDPDGYIIEVGQSTALTYG